MTGVDFGPSDRGAGQREIPDVVENSIKRPGRVTVAAALTILGGIAEGLIASLLVLFAMGEHEKHSIFGLAFALALFVLSVMGVWGGWLAWKGRSRTLLMTVSGIHLALVFSAFVFIWAIYIREPHHRSEELVICLLLTVVLFTPSLWSITTITLVLLRPSAAFFHPERRVEASTNPSR